ncbi:MAG: hypothetical protein ACLQVI_32695 [Polyangiaceae bacterium]
MLDDIGGFRGMQFQDFCSRLLSLDDSTFQAVDGSGGDLGNDGFCVRGETLYQAYAPEKVTLGKMRSKVDDSVKKATDLRDTAFPTLARVVFLTPFDLTEKMHEHVRSACAAANLAPESWGESRLHALVLKHPEIRAAFPEFLIPDIVGAVTDAIATRLPAETSVDDERALSLASAESLRWSRVLPGGETLPRPELDQLFSELGTTEGKCFAILGIPGSGKSAFLASLAERLASSGETVVALRCDRIPAAVRNREELANGFGLCAAVDQALAGMAARTPTVLLVDQLDALCDIVDIHSERLNAVLDLLGRVRDVDGLRVVVACRGFDYRHDARLVRLEAKAIQLELPPWSAIESVLRANGVSPEHFPASTREVLRVPQHLKVFLSLAGSRDSLQSYQGMLARFWQERVAPNADRVSLARLITKRMEEDEVLAVPVSLADGMAPTLERLQAEGVLRVDGTSRTISFAHQTLFEFARARAFGEGEDLVAYVKQRQSGIFVRPTLWSALVFLREANRAVYSRDLAALWNDTTLRLHIRHLLLELVGQVTDPTEDEWTLLFGAMRDRTMCATAVAATAGNAEWFSRLRRTGVLGPDLLALAPQALAAVLTSEVRRDPDRVAEILRALGSTPSASRMTLFVLQSVEGWTPALQSLARNVAAESPPATDVVHALTARAARFAPELALELMAMTLDALLPAAFERVADGDPWISREDKDADAVSDFTQRLFELRELAKQAPSLTLVRLFPTWERLGERLSAAKGSRVVYRRERALEIIVDGTHPSEFLGALLHAVKASAASDPGGFVALARRVEGSDLNCVHALLAVGFAALPPAHQREGLEYVKRDPRRLRIHGLGDQDSGSVSLLRAVGPHLKPEDFPSLEKLIEESKVVEEVAWEFGAKGRRVRTQANRIHRLRLLCSLPQELLSEQARRIVREESQVFPDAAAEPSRPRLDCVVSPMSAAQMEKATDEDVLRLLDELPDETESQHPRRPLRGGSNEASRELAALAKRAPERVVGLLAALRPEDQQAPMREVLAALDESGFERFEELLLDADARGFASEEFRTRMAYSVARRALDGKRISDDVVALLERWLDAAPPAKGSTTREVVDTPTESLLFDGFGGGALPGGGYPFARALMCACFRREPPASERWLACLERRLAGPAAESEWVPLCHQMPRLGWLPDRERVTHFFTRLFARHPGLLECKEGAYLIARLVTRLDEALVRGWITKQLGSEHVVAQQGGGELLIVCAVQRPSAWVDTELARFRTAEVAGRVHVGVAHGAAHTWGDPSTRRVGAAWLAARLPVAEGDELEALLGAYHPRHELWADAAATDVLRAVMRNPAALRAFPDDGLDQLELLAAHHEGPLVADFVNAMLDAMQAAGIDAAARFGWSGGVLVDLTLTLQRRTATREAGMGLLERLLSLGFSSVRDVFFEIDGLPRRGPPMPRAPRYRRSQS